MVGKINYHVSHSKAVRVILGLKLIVTSQIMANSQAMEIVLSQNLGLWIY